MNCQFESEFRRRMMSSLERIYYYELGLNDWKERAELRIKGTHGRKIAEILKGVIALKNKRVLDVGCGWGELVVSSNLHGAEAFGIDLDKELVEISKLRAKIYDVDEGNFVISVGENIPFIKNTFDVVACIDVLEHVQKPAKVIKEMLRVLKPEGVCFIRGPNYLRPYEPHYKMFWIPLLPKSFAKGYLILRGKKTDFIEHINYVTPFSILKILKSLNVSIKNLAEEEIMKKINNINSIDSKKWRLIVKVINFFHISSFFLKIFVLLNRGIFYMVVKHH